MIRALIGCRAAVTTHRRYDVPWCALTSEATLDERPGYETRVIAAFPPRTTSATHLPMSRTTAAFPTDTGSSILAVDPVGGHLNLGPKA
jgi:hypothetical protein